MSTTSPNMNLHIPTVGSDSGPTYADLVNSCLTLIDSHSHTTGSGVPITPDAISMTSNLTFLGFGAVDVSGVTFATSLASPGDVTVYSDGTDLFYTDGDANDIQITQNGGIAGSPGSISNLTSPASAAYVSAASKFVWQSNTNIAANMDCGSIIMRNLSPNSTFALTLAPPASLSSNYSVTLPTLPGATSFMTITSSGAVAATIGTVGGITNGNIADATIQQDKLADTNYIRGATLTATYTSTTTVTLAGDLTASNNRPVFVTLRQGASTEVPGGITISSGTWTITINLYSVNDVTDILELGTYTTSSALQGLTFCVTPDILASWDPTFRARMILTRVSGSGSVTVNNLSTSIMELL